jgi:hypothetical protein
MYAASKLSVDFFQLRIELLTHRLSQYRKPSFSCLSADVRKAQKVECLRLPFPTARSVLPCKTAKFDKPCVGGVANLYNLRYVCCMVRQARLDAPGVLHHVMARGIERLPIFIDDRDRDEFVRRLSDLALEGKLIVYVCLSG